jgi:CDP-diacylglycerol--serine O-phosphatidyltransferase
MIGFYDYTVVLTYLGFISGMLGIVVAARGDVFISVLCLMFSGFCDMFDGKVARTKKNRKEEEKHFGIQLDSLSDLVCFGVLPAVIGYQIGINRSYLVPLIIFYPLAGLIRLAYFNMLETLRDGDGPVKEYIGLPITSAALIFPFIFIFRKFLGKYFVLVYGILLFVIGMLFISKIKIKKPKTKQMILMILVGILEILLILTVRKFL